MTDEFTDQSIDPANPRPNQEMIILQPDHHWDVPEGYKIFVLDRGAVRINVPETWFFEPLEKAFRFVNDQPPNDDCHLNVVFYHLPPDDWASFPLEDALRQTVEDDPRNVIHKGEIIPVKRQTARIFWTEVRYINTQAEGRLASSRICLGLGSNIQCSVTMDCWADEVERFAPVWDEVMRSLTLGLYIRDPEKGLAYPD